MNVQVTTPFDGTAVKVERPLLRSMLRGLKCRCPNCGEGKLFAAFSKPVDQCAKCDEELHHHRADDGPAYLTILIVGHLMAPLFLITFIKFRPEPITLIAIFSVGTVALSLFLLPRLKGALIGLQWAKRMHGFGQVHADE